MTKQIRTWCKLDMFQVRYGSSSSAPYCIHLHLTSIIDHNKFIDNEAFKPEVFKSISMFFCDRSTISGGRFMIFSSRSTIYAFRSTSFCDIEWPNRKSSSISTVVVALLLQWNTTNSSPSLSLWSPWNTNISMDQVCYFFLFLLFFFFVFLFLLLLRCEFKVLISHL